ncbi:hypothetical protein [Nostoc sp. CHAB 5836]|nr:hypothetical protein [Nostoc sp. CHAB 5836]
MTGFVCYPEYPELDDPDYESTEDWDVKMIKNGLIVVLCLGKVAC